MDGTSENFMVHAPYRLSPLGAHTDHQGGLTCGITLREGITLHAESRPGQEVQLRSKDFDGEASFLVSEAAEALAAARRESNAPLQWTAYAQAATAVLSEHHLLERGICGKLVGSLPSGGISSSAALTVAVMLALVHANGLRIKRLQLAKWCREAERLATGVTVGLLDPAVILHGKERALVVVDAKAEAVRVHGFNRILGDMHWLLIDCGEQRWLKDSPYNQRVAECQEAARLLRSAAELAGATDRGSDGLSAVPPEVFRRLRAQLPETLQRRADHYYAEVRRVKQGLSALSAGDLVSFGRLMTASGVSLARSFDCGTARTQEALDLLLAQEDILGASFAGGGFGGHVQALFKDATSREAAAGKVVEALSDGASPGDTPRAYSVAPGRQASVTEPQV